MTGEGRAEWLPIPGVTVMEQGENYATAYPAFYECPRCAAAVQRGSLEKHDNWHILSGFSAGLS